LETTDGTGVLSTPNPPRPSTLPSGKGDNNEQDEECILILKSFPELITSFELNVPPKHKAKYHILMEEHPVFQCPHRLHTEKEAAVKQEINAMLKTDIIIPLKSPWTSPLHLMYKGFSNWKPCSDYRFLNN